MSDALSDSQVSNDGPLHDAKSDQDSDLGHRDNHPGQGWIFLQFLAGGFFGGTFGIIITVPLGYMAGTAIGEWFDPGSRSRPHAFEEPPAILGVLGGWFAGILVGALLAVRMSLSDYRRNVGKKPPGDCLDDLS